MTALIKNARLPDGGYKSILIENGLIADILAADTDISADRIYDAKGNYVYPGLIDVHSHGCIGIDTMDGEGLSELAKEYFRHGVTTWYPTTMTESYERIRKAMAQPLERGEGEARTPGYHYEGPFINVKFKGAQNEAYIVAPDLDEYKNYVNPAVVTVAPETEGAMDFIREAAANGTCIALGHTECDFDTAMAAFAAGAKCLTHTCNAMPQMMHRAPGPIGAAKMSGAYAQVISDGQHMHPAMVNALYRMFGREKMVLISDSIRACGLPEGEYELGGQMFTVKDGAARIANGSLAGSTTPLFECVRRAISFGIPREDAFAMASETPAAMLGINKGKIEVGYAAEFIVCSEENELLDTLIY